MLKVLWSTYSHENINEGYNSLSLIIIFFKEKKRKDCDMLISHSFQTSKLIIVGSQIVAQTQVE